MDPDPDVDPFHGLGDLRTERSRIREILVLVPAIALMVNVGSAYLVKAGWEWQLGVILAAFLLSALVIQKSPLFAISGRLSNFVQITYDANQHHIVSNVQAGDLAKGPLVTESFVFSLQPLFQKLAEAGLEPPAPHERPLPPRIEEALADASFFWILQSLGRDFQKSWARKQLIPIGIGHYIHQEPTPGRLTPVLAARNGSRLLERHSVFQQGPLDLSDLQIYLPNAAHLERIEAPHTNHRAVRIRSGATSVNIRFELGGWATGLPADAVKELMDGGQAGTEMDDVLEEQRYWADVAQIAAVIRVEYKVKPWDVFGPSFDKKVAWIEAIAHSISQRCRRDATHVSVERT